MIICIDVTCEAGHTTEVFVDSKMTTMECPVEGCEEQAKRIISPVRTSLDPISGDYPGATMKWMANREKQMAVERKAVARHGPEAAWDVARGRR